MVFTYANIIRKSFKNTWNIKIWLSLFGSVGWSGLKTEGKSKSPIYFNLRGFRFTRIFEKNPNRVNRGLPVIT